MSLPNSKVEDRPLKSINISQSVAILIDGNNMEKSIHEQAKDGHAMLNFDSLIPKILDNRGLNRLIYFREGISISSKLADRLHDHYHGSVVPCHKSADIPLSIKATQLSKKVDTIIILSGDSDYVELVRHLRSEGVRVEIAAVVDNTAKILIEEADHFTPITKDDWFVYNPGTQRRPKSKNSQSKKNKSNRPHRDRERDKTNIKSTTEGKKHPSSKSKTHSDR